MAQQIHRSSDGVNDGGDIYCLAIMSIGGIISAFATATAVHDTHAKAALKRWHHICPRLMVASSAMHK